MKVRFPVKTVNEIVNTEWILFSHNLERNVTLHFAIFSPLAALNRNDHLQIGSPILNSQHWFSEACAVGLDGPQWSSNEFWDDKLINVPDLPLISLF